MFEILSLKFLVLALEFLYYHHHVNYSISKILMVLLQQRLLRVIIKKSKGKLFCLIMGILNKFFGGSD